MIYEDLERAELERKDQFDCVLLLNVLHLVPEPQKLLSLSREFMHSRSTFIVQSPNMMSLRALRQHLKGTPRLMPFGDYGSTRAHFSSARTVRNWLINSGLGVEEVIGVRTDPGDGMLGRISATGDYLPRTISLPLATSIVVTGTKAEVNARQIA
jgi:hypothetical protein